LISDLGKIEWPEEFPNFFTFILEQLQSKSSELLGLKLLKTFVEEVMCPRKDIVNSRRLVLLKTLLHAQYPICFHILSEKLTTALAGNKKSNYENSFGSLPGSPHSSPEVSGVFSVPNSPFLGRAKMNINTFQDQEAICFELLSCIIIMIPYAKPEHLKEKNLALRIFNVFYDPLVFYFHCKSQKQIF
jgi:hypothetical protein